MPAIETEKLTRAFGETVAVDALSFAIMPGELFGFLGPNGAGKTTTLRMLTGQLRPTAGRAAVCGYDVVNDRQQLASAIGVVFDQQNLYLRSSVKENLRFAARLYGAPRRRIAAVLEIVGLADRARKKAAELSNGQKQRVLIARALLHEPRVLFLDEPTRGLDPQAAQDIRSCVAALAAAGVTIFLTTHYMEEADRLCDRVAIIDGGHIVALDTPASLKAQQGADATLEDVFLALTGRRLETRSQSWVI